MAKKKQHPSSPKKPRRYRDTMTGRFVTKTFAKKNRETTVKEPITT
jgi:hypothetical protein